MLGERIASQSEVIRAIISGYSPSEKAFAWGSCSEAVRPEHIDAPGDVLGWGLW